MCGMDDQKELLRGLDESGGRSWVLVLDCGRADAFQQLFLDHLPDGASYQTVYNGGLTMTPMWFEEMWSYDVDGHLFHGGNPINTITSENFYLHYDESEWWEEVPSDALYADYTCPGGVSTPSPAGVNEVVRQHLPDGSSVDERLEALGYMDGGSTGDKFNMNVVRYLQPHTPYRQSELGEQWDGLRDSIRDGDLTVEELQEMYADNYRWGFKHAVELAEELAERPKTSNVVITADHGECLWDCGEWLHGCRHPEHEHLTNVPWVEWPVED